MNTTRATQIRFSTQTMDKISIIESYERVVEFVLIATIIKYTNSA